MTITTSGCAAATSSHVAWREGSPEKPSTSSPPAISMSCGVQWPATKTGSIHSRAATRGRGAPRTASRMTSARRAVRAMRSSAASLAFVACATVRTSPTVSPYVVGSSEMTRGGPGSVCASACTSSTDTAQTWHSAWVTMRSGSSSRTSSSSSS